MNQYERSLTASVRFLGFSLLEMMIVLLIVSILISFAYPSYQAYWVRMHRLEGQTALLELANQMEIYFQQHGTYRDARLGTQTARDVIAPPSEGYELMIESASDSHYVIRAVANAVLAKQDKDCQTLELNEQGLKTALGHKECWE